MSVEHGSFEYVPAAELLREMAERFESEHPLERAVREARQSSFEVFEDRGPGVSAPPEGITRRDRRGRR
jgi:hypothetical protein